MRFINAESWEKLDKVANLNPKIKKAVDMVKVIGQNKEEREAYLAREMAIRDEISRLDERREEGLEEGIEIGIEKEKKRMVENLLALNIEEEKIMKASGLSKEDILKIKEEMNI
ncbi:Rpn family recombination-promoting nuclease/putative transposase [Clostridium disporicum]|uniref:Rpn family recombination-promoting nuclease/putative transposase n=1 Tax=Clostridium disporicum TaxID=84024 RepID=UPI0034A3A49C